MKYLLGVDFGGGASKATLLSENGSIIAASTVEYPTLYPRSGWAEQNPSDWYRAIVVNIRSVIEKSGISACDIAAVCLDAATHTAVLCDGDFNVLRPAIYWTDTRSTEEVRYLNENFGETVLKQSLHTADTIWTLPQLLWVKQNEPEIWAKCEKILFAKDYIRHMLTGDYVTDYIEAQGSMLFDCGAMSWSDELCGIIGFAPERLAQIVSPRDIAGYITPEAAGQTGLAEGTPVLCGTTDTAMEVFAAGATSAGNMTVKLATAGRICVITDRAYPNRHLINYSHIRGGLWYPGTATKSCAASYRWFRDTFGGDYRELDKCAKGTPIGCGGLMFHPYLGGELTPYGDPLLRASFTGISAQHTKGAFARAVLEGVAFSLLDCKKYLETLNIPHDTAAFIIGGGSLSPLWRQIIADTLGIVLYQKESSDSSLGSAMLAGIAAGVFHDEADAVEKCTKIISKTEPDMENHEKYARIFKKYKAVYDALAPVYNCL